MMSASEPRPMTVTGPVSRYRWPSMSRIGWLGVALAEAAGAAPPRRVEDSISMAGAVRSASGTKETLTGPTKE